MSQFIFNPPSDSDIEKYEEIIGARLPLAYRKFLQNRNGGSPFGEGNIIVDGWGSTCIFFLYGINTGRKETNLDWIYSIQSDDVEPYGIVPIAADPGGYKVYLGVSDGNSGAVFFWDRGEALEAPVLLNQTFSDFLTSIDRIA
jgi:hypothetical protein